MKKGDNFRHAIVSTDIVVFTYNKGNLYSLLVEVKNKEYLGQKAFPGALILPEENTKMSVNRVIEAKLSLPAKKIYIEELGAYSELNRDVRGRVVSIAFLGLVDFQTLCDFKNDKFEMVELNKIHKLAYDHNQILKDAVERLKEKFFSSTISQKLLEEQFTMTELYNLYCVVLGREIDKRNFVKKIKSLQIVGESGKILKGQKHRPAKLFEFKDSKVKQLEIF